MRRNADVSISSSPAGDLRRLGPFLRPYLWPILFGTVCGILGIAAELFPPLVWGYVVDKVIKSRQVSGLYRPVMLMAAVYLAGVALTAARRNVMEKAGQAFLFDLRNTVYRKLQRQSLAYFGEHRTGDLMARVGGEIDTIQEVVIRGTDAVVANALRLVGVAAIFIVLQWELGLICLMPIVLVGIGLKLYNARIKAMYRVSRARLGDVGATLQDDLSGIRVIKAFAREDDEQENFERATQEYRLAQVKVINLSTRFFPIVRYIAQWGQILMLGFGAYFIMVGRFTVGGLVTYRGYGRYFFGPIDDLMDINDTLQRASAAWGRVLEVLDAPEAITDAASAVGLANVRGEVRFDDVSFGYTADRNVLEGVSFSAWPGRMVALVGTSGAGKSTVLNLVPRFWDVTGGRVLVDGNDVRNLTQASLRGALAIVQQDTFLFNDTILNNIRYGRPDASAEDVEAAARMANAHEFITEMPEGYDTVVGERGVKLSGGQRQRISIARAFLTDPRILLLDEATSAVEAESEWIIQAALERLMAGRTTIIVSHRMSMVRGADEILVLDGGRIVERGRHGDLMAENGPYARMVNMQRGEPVDVA
ncbi:MAG TPA: ABC transporter ATP-binding protein [Armatimonadota bacterium]|jgi:ABC-type multidrug transport system fused ATPase/permease subunit